MYHDKALAMIGRGPAQGEKDPALPPSVAEWYSQPDAVALLREYSNDDCPLEVAKFQAHTVGDQVLNVFMRENQDVVW